VYCISSRERLTRGDTSTWELGEGLTGSHRKNPNTRSHREPSLAGV
jgi:hypothetical protein